MCDGGGDERACQYWMTARFTSYSGTISSCNTLIQQPYKKQWDLQVSTALPVNIATSIGQEMLMHQPVQWI